MTQIMNKYERLMLEQYGKRYAEYRRLYKSDALTIKSDFPLQIDFDFLDGCNLKCPACHSIGRERSGKTMDKSLISEIARECGENKMPAVNIGGCSEPLVNVPLTLYAVSEFKKASVMDIFLHTNAVLMDGGVSAGLIDSGVTFLCVSLDAATPQTYRKQRGADLDKVVKNIHAFLNRKTSPLPALRVSFLATPDNIHERDLFIDSWENVADFVEVQEYYKSYDSQPEELGAFQKSEKSEILERVKESESFSDYGKRLSIIAPDILSRSCGGVDVTEAIRKGDTLSKYGTVKNYWKQKESLQA